MAYARLRTLRELGNAVENQEILGAVTQVQNTHSHITNIRELNDAYYSKGHVILSEASLEGTQVSLARPSSS